MAHIKDNVANRMLENEQTVTVTSVFAKSPTYIVAHLDIRSQRKDLCGRGSRTSRPSKWSLCGWHPSFLMTKMRGPNCRKKYLPKQLPVQMKKGLIYWENKAGLHPTFRPTYRLPIDWISRAKEDIYFFGASQTKRSKTQKATSNGRDYNLPLYSSPPSLDDPLSRGGY